MLPKKRQRINIYVPLLLLILLGIRPILYSQSPFHDYFKDYCALLNNYTDSYNTSADRAILQGDIANLFAEGEQTIVHNDIRPDGSKYINLEEYLNNLLIHFPKGVKVSFEDLTHEVDYDQRLLDVQLTLIYKDIATKQSSLSPLYFHLKWSNISSRLTARILSVEEFVNSENRRTSEKEEVTSQIITDEKEIQDEESKPIVPTNTKVKSGSFIGNRDGQSNPLDNVLPSHDSGSDSSYYSGEEVTCGSSCKTYANILVDVEGELEGERAIDVNCHNGTTSWSPSDSGFFSSGGKTDSGTISDYNCTAGSYTLRYSWNIGQSDEKSATKTFTTDGTCSSINITLSNTIFGSRYDMYITGNE